MSRIYLDHNATSPMLPSVVAAMRHCCGVEYGNPASAHAEGRASKAVMGKARTQVAALIGARPEEIIFTSGGTEADNMALRGVLNAAGPGSELVTTAIEHKAVLEPAMALRRAGFGVYVQPVNDQGQWPIATLVRDAIAFDPRGGPALVSVMLANNEIGTRYPVHLLAASTHRRGGLLHTDAVNALGKVPIDVQHLGVDLLSLSAHKIGGPKGIGALYVRKGTVLAPYLLGGGQEDGFRSGTPNVPAIAGFGAAAVLAQRRLSRGEGGRQAALRGTLERGVTNQLAGVRINAAAAPRLPNTSSLTFAGVNPQELVAALDQQGIAASAGSACSCQSGKPSHVLQAIGCDEGAVRFSLGPSTTQEDIAYTVGAVVQAVKHLRS